MTDYEMLSLVGELFNGMMLLFTTYVSIVFAFLVAGSLAAPHLNRVLAWTAVLLFTLACVYIFGAMMVLGDNMTALSGIMRDAVADGRADLGRFRLARPEGDAIRRPAAWLVRVLMLSSYAGAVFFFWYQRKTKLRLAQAQATAP